MVSAYGVGIEKSGEEIEGYWKELNEGVTCFGRKESVVVLEYFKCQSGI